MEFPIGIAANVGAVALGALLGGLMKRVLPKKIADSLFLVTAFCAFSIGILSVIKLKSLTVVILSVLFGCVVGELCGIEEGIGRVNARIVAKLGARDGAAEREETLSLLGLSVAIICFSGTGIFGALSEGLAADHSILLAKSVLDFFTVLVIAATTGCIVAVFAVPQLVIYVALFFLASLIAPLLGADAVGNFKSVGGVLTMVIGYNMLASQNGLKKVRVLNLTPAFVLVLAFSWIVAKTGLPV